MDHFRSHTSGSIIVVDQHTHSNTYDNSPKEPTANASQDPSHNICCNSPSGELCGCSDYTVGPIRTATVKDRLSYLSILDFIRVGNRIKSSVCILHELAHTGYRRNALKNCGNSILKGF